MCQHQTHLCDFNFVTAAGLALLGRRFGCFLDIANEGAQQKTLGLYKKIPRVVVFKVGCDVK